MSHSLIWSHCTVQGYEPEWWRRWVVLMRFHPVSIPGNRSLALYLSETVLCKVENRWFSTPFCLLSLLRRCVQSTTRSTGNHDAEIVMLHIRGARTNLHFALYGGNCHKMRQAVRWKTKLCIVRFTERCQRTRAWCFRTSGSFLFFISLSIGVCPSCRGNPVIMQHGTESVAQARTIANVSMCVGAVKWEASIR